MFKKHIEFKWFLRKPKPRSIKKVSLNKTTFEVNGGQLDCYRSAIDQNIKYAQAVKCKLTRQVFTTAAVRGNSNSISQLNTSQQNKGIHFYNSWFSTQCIHSLSPPVNIEEVYIRNKIHLFLGILWSAFEMWYSTNNKGGPLHECIKWDGGLRCVKKNMGLMLELWFDLQSGVGIKAAMIRAANATVPRGPGWRSRSPTCQTTFISSHN